MKRHSFFLLLLVALLPINSVSRADMLLDCANYWVHGHPFAADSAETIPCREFVPPDPIRIAGGGEYRIFYPSSWSADGYLHLMETVAMGLEESVLTYRRYGRVPPIYVLLSDDVTDGADAEAGSPHQVEPFEACPIIIYRTALDADEDDLKQLVAHEVFHCFQNENLGLQSSGPWNPVYADRLFLKGISKWWVESSAVFFSNIVYPVTNAEFSSTRLYKPHKSLFEQENGYPNAIFFQYLANRLDEAHVLDLLGDLPTEGGLTDQKEALARHPLMATKFHSYGEQYFDVNGIRDTGGGRVLADQSVRGAEMIKKPGSYKFDVNPFALNAWALWFPEAKRIRVNLVDEGRRYRASHRRGFRGLWRAAFNREFTTSCLAGETFDLLITSIATETTVFRVTLVVEMEDDSDAMRCNCDRVVAAADRCLIGNWVADEDSLRSKMGASARSKLEGTLRLNVSPKGYLKKSFEGIRVTSINEDLGRFDWTLSGFVEGCADTTAGLFGPGQFRLNDVRASSEYFWLFSPRAAYIKSPAPGLHDGNGDEPMGLRWHSANDRPQTYKCRGNNLTIRGLKLNKEGE